MLSKPLNLKAKKLIYSTSMEFADFAMEHIKLGKEYNKKTLFNEFTKAYPDFENSKQRAFTNWITTYVEINGFTIKERHSGLEYYFSVVEKIKP